MKTLTTRAVIVAALIALASAIVAAYGAFYSDAALGTVVPAPATAFLSCYQLDPGFDVVGGSPRPDVIGTFVRAESDGHKTVCYLRAPDASGGPWTSFPAATTNRRTP